MLEELSNTFYPGAYCNCVERTQKACYEENILELWADQASQQNLVITSVSSLVITSVSSLVITSVSSLVITLVSSLVTEKQFYLKSASDHSAERKTECDQFYPIDNIINIDLELIHLSCRPSQISIQKDRNIAKFPFASVTLNRGFIVDKLSLIHLSQIEHFQGSYSQITEDRLARLTQQEIIDVINTKNTSQIFMKDFDFKDLLGNVRYNESGHIIGELRVF